MQKLCQIKQLLYCVYGYPAKRSLLHRPPNAFKASLKALVSKDRISLPDTGSVPIKTVSVFSTEITPVAQATDIVNYASEILLIEAEPPEEPRTPVDLAVFVGVPLPSLAKTSIVLSDR